MIAERVVEEPQWLDAVLLRQGLYRLLAGTLEPPTTELLDALRDAAAVLDGMSVVDFPFAGPVLSLLDALQRPDDPLAINIEHVRLFESGVDGALCPPTESYYLADPVGSVIGDLQRDCIRLGLSVSRTSGLEPDHISTLLEVQSALCAQEAQGWAAGDRDVVVRAIRNQRWFLERHLARWVVAFSRRIHNAGAISPYREVGPAVEAVVRSDRQLLTALATQMAEVAS